MVQCTIGTIQFVACVSVSGPELFMPYVVNDIRNYLGNKLYALWVERESDLHILCNPGQYMMLHTQVYLKQAMSAAEEPLIQGYNSDT